MSNLKIVLSFILSFTNARTIREIFKEKIRKIEGRFGRGRGVKVVFSKPKIWI